MTPSHEGWLLFLFGILVLSVAALLLHFLISTAKEILEACFRAFLTGGVAAVVAALYAPQIGDKWHDAATKESIFLVLLGAVIIGITGIFLIFRLDRTTCLGICLILGAIPTAFLRIDKSHDPSTGWFEAAAILTAFLFFSLPFIPINGREESG